MRVTVFDGAESIGGNKIYVQEGDHGVFLDFGLNFAVSGKYFKEFISPRAIRGLHDFLEMGLIPELDIYRTDLYPADVSKDLFKKLPVDAVLITHAHMDHYGLVGFLDFSIPVVASPETLAIIKAYQDSGQTKTETSVLYSAIRTPKPSSLPVLQSNGNRIKGEDSARRYLRFRPIISTENVGEDFRSFMTELGKDYKNTVAENRIKYGGIEELPWKIKAIPVDHSIYGAVGYIIRMDSHTIAYTGDFRVHGERGESTLKFAGEAREADILITEGTRLSEDREHIYISEEEVAQNCSEAVAGQDGKLVIADFSARNFERLKIFSRIASEYGRTLVITDKDAYALLGLSAAGNQIHYEGILVYDKPSDKGYWWKKKLQEDSVWEGKFVNPVEIRENPGDYILAFSLYDMPNLMDIKPDGGLYLYSSTEAFNEDMELDFITLANWLERYSMTSVGFRVVNGKPEFEKGYHASGHAGPEELERIIDIIDPEVIIPVHTVNPGWFVERYGERVRIPRNGEEITF